MRIDKLLWFLRFAKTRGAGQALAATGHVRLNGRRVERAAQEVRVGDVLVVPRPRTVTALELLALPLRRGPASEARACYRTLDATRDNPIAADPTTPEGTSPP